MAKRKNDAADPAIARQAIRYNGRVGTVANQGALNRPRRWILDDPEFGTRNVGASEGEVPLEEAVLLVELGNFEWASRHAEALAEPKPEAEPTPEA